MNESARLRLGFTRVCASRRDCGQHRLYHIRYAGAACTGHRKNLSAGPHRLPQQTTLCADRLGIESIDLVEPDDLGFFGEAVTIMGEFFADRGVSAGDIVEGAVH